MKITLKALTKHTIDKLIINSLEQALYQALVVIDGEEHVVWQNEKKVLLSHNLMEIRKHFIKLEIPSAVLRHQSPYDEMIGQSNKSNQDANRLEVPLSNNPYGSAKWLQ